MNLDIMKTGLLAFVLRFDLLLVFLYTFEWCCNCDVQMARALKTRTGIDMRFQLGDYNSHNFLEFNIYPFKVKGFRILKWPFWLIILCNVLFKR